MSADRSQDRRDEGAPLDPVYLHARREAAIILVVFAICLVWSITVCVATGYYGADEPIEHIRTVWGIPTWVFWGIVVPWVAATTFTFLFAARIMADDDLGEDAELSETGSPDDARADRSLSGRSPD